MTRSAVHKLFKLHHNKAIQSLPKPYLDYLEQYKKPPTRVHDDPPQTKFLDYNQDHETGYVYREPDQPIPVVNPPNSEKGLWGGLSIVEYLYKPKKLKPRSAHLWRPMLEKHTFYSDILDCHINIEVTGRTLELIDKHQGFDFYILETPVQDLVSELGRRLKHKMLIALANESRDYIKTKYQDYIKPIEEVGWYGLKEHEALTKFRLMRVEESIEPPLKVMYAKQLLDAIKSQEEKSE